MAKDYFAGGVIYRKGPNGLELLAVTVKTTEARFQDQKPQVKFPGGTNDGHPEDRGVLDTLRREIEEETGLRVKKEARLEMIYYEKLKADPFRQRPPHFKEFYLVSFDECEGELRSEESRGTDTMVSVPRWYEVDELKWVLYRTHQKALLHTLDHLSCMV